VNLTQKVLLITDKAHVDYELAGGVQLCTNEFITYFEKAGYIIEIFRVQPALTKIKKLKIRMGLEAYSLYEIDHYVNSIVAKIRDSGINIILFNQVNLGHWAANLKNVLPHHVRYICLSHGNESGDYLHDLTQERKPSFTDTWRLGKLLIREKQIFQDLDGVITISEQETAIDSWIGAKRLLFLPRILKPNPVNWQPNNERIGFVGTLNHLPNLEGIRLLAEELTKVNFAAELVLVGGPELIGRKLAMQYPFIKYKGSLDNTQLLTEIQNWSLFLNPVFWYARGSSTKLAQAINWCIPVLTTPAGARGYELADKAIISDDNNAASYAKAVIDALGSTDSLIALKNSAEVNCKSFDINFWTSELRSFVQNVQL
jgi:glycosyltransferase involved in cell wall biosynthesis